MGLSLEDIDKELAARQGMGDSSVDEIDAELQKRGVQTEGMMSKLVHAFPDVAQKVATAAMPEVAGAIQASQTPEIANPLKSAMAVPYQGLRGLATTATSGLQRGAEATKPGFEPQGIKEHLADLVASTGDPRNMVMNPVAGEAFGLAKKVGAPVGKFIGKQAARAVQVATGVPAEDVLKTAAKPTEVLFSKLAKNSGKIFQKAKDAAGVSEAEERLIAGIGDPSGFKRVADDMAEEFAKNKDLTVGQALAWKKAAGELARKGKGSARFLYSQDASQAEKILAEKAPDVLATQKDVGLSKLRESFMSVLPRNKGAGPAVLRSGAAMGLGVLSHPLAAVAMSPLLAGLPATVGAGMTLKGLNALGTNPVTRQILLGILSKLKGTEQPQGTP